MKLIIWASKWLTKIVDLVFFCWVSFGLQFVVVSDEFKQDRVIEHHGQLVDRIVSHYLISMTSCSQHHPLCLQTLIDRFLQHLVETRLLVQVCQQRARLGQNGDREIALFATHGTVETTHRETSCAFLVFVKLKNTSWSCTEGRKDDYGLTWIVALYLLRQELCAMWSQMDRAKVPEWLIQPSRKAASIWNDKTLIAIIKLIRSLPTNDASGLLFKTFSCK